MTTPEAVLEFWFGGDLGTFEGVLKKLEYWTPTLDDAVRTRFGETLERALAGELDDWGTSHDGTLALTLVLDQLSRHAYRGTARQYAGDARATLLALAAWDDGWPLGMGAWQAMFMSLPLAHSENLAHHERHLEVAARVSAACPAYFGEVAQIPTSQARKYHDIIKRFGRFPHRNAMLGRSSTPAELEWLHSGGPERMPPDLIKRLLA